MLNEQGPRDAATVPEKLIARANAAEAENGHPGGADGLLGRDAILGAPDLATYDVDVPEWGGVVRVRMLTARERDAFEASCMKTKRDGSSEFNPVNVRAKLVALCLVDAQGQRLFGEDDISALGRKSAKALSRIFTEASKLNGLTADDVKSLEGNSDGQGDDSSSDSLWPVDEPTSSDSSTD